MRRMIWVSLLCSPAHNRIICKSCTVIYLPSLPLPFFPQKSQSWYNVSQLCFYWLSVCMCVCACVCVMNERSPCDLGYWNTKPSWGYWSSRDHWGLRQQQVGFSTAHKQGNRNTTPEVCVSVRSLYVFWSSEQSWQSVLQFSLVPQDGALTPHLAFSLVSVMFNCTFVADVSNNSTGWNGRVDTTKCQMVSGDRSILDICRILCCFVPVFLLPMCTMFPSLPSMKDNTSWE